MRLRLKIGESLEGLSYKIYQISKHYVQGVPYLYIVLGF